MGSHYLRKDYLQKIKRIYQDRSEEIEKKYNDLKKVDADFHRVMLSREYTPEGKQKRLNALDAQRNALKKELAAIRDAANNEARAVRESVETLFYDYYNAAPGDVDLKLTELIRSGVLSDAELIHYGNKANSTMRRLIGKELESRPSREAKEAASAFRRLTDNPHLKAIDAIMEIGDYAVGGARLGGLATVHNIRSRFDELIDPIIDGTQDVKLTINADMSNSYAVEGSAQY